MIIKILFRLTGRPLNALEYDSNMKFHGGDIIYVLQSNIAEEKGVF